MLAGCFCAVLLCLWGFSDPAVMWRCAQVARLFWPGSLVSSPCLTTDSDLQTVLGKRSYGVTSQPEFSSGHIDKRLVKPYLISQSTAAPFQSIGIDRKPVYRLRLHDQNRYSTASILDDFLGEESVGHILAALVSFLGVRFSRQTAAESGPRGLHVGLSPRSAAAHTCFSEGGDLAKC